MKYTSIHEYLSMFYTKYIYNFIFFEYGLGILFINIIVYTFILASFFSIFFFFNLKYFRTLNEIKGLNNYNFLLMATIFSLLSLAGIPPLIGFVSKFLLLIFISHKNQFLLFLLFVIINSFMIYFYTQNIKFLTKNTILTIFVVKLNFFYINLKLVLNLCLLNFLNIFGLFFFEDIVLIGNFWSSFLWLG